MTLARLKISFARALILASLALIFVNVAVAQSATATPSPTVDDEPDFIVPARPTVSNPAEFQHPGVLQIEFGYSGNFRAPGVATEHDFPLAVRFAASRRLLLEFDADSPISQRATGDTAQTGFGDFLVGSQFVLQHETESKPGVAFAYYLKLPAASAARGLGTGRVDHNFIALISKNVKGATVDFNAIYLLAGRTTNIGHASSVQAALAASRNVSKRFGVQAEVSGFTRNDAQPGAVFALGVVTFQPNKRLVFDCGIRKGLTREAPRIGAVAGMTVGVADLYRKRRAEP